MAIVGQFERLATSVQPIKGPPFNLHWSALGIPSNLLSIAFSYTNAGALPMWISKIYASSVVSCDIELRINSTVQWNGGTTVINLHPEPWDFTDAEFLLPVGGILQVFIKHKYGFPRDFAGNIGGFSR
jgi:hypothetical protein